MKKKILKYLLMIAPFLMILAVYSKLPAEVPMHWNIHGEIDRYGSRNELFLIAGLNVFFGVFLSAIAKIDPKQKNYMRFRETYEWIIIWTLGFMTVLMGIVLTETIQPGTVNTSKVVCVMVGVLFVALGNMMPKVKQNYFTGVKTPWALSNDVVWNKTQRLGGKSLVLGGILILLSAFLSNGKVMVFVIIGVSVLVSIVPTVMSYIWYQQEVRNGRNAHEEG